MVLANMAKVIRTMIHWAIFRSEQPQFMRLTVLVPEGVSAGFEMQGLAMEFPDDPDVIQRLQMLQIEGVRESPSLAAPALIITSAITPTSTTADG